MLERLMFWRSSEKKEDVDVKELVTDFELRTCLNKLVSEEKNVFQDASKGVKAHREIVQSVLKIQLALKAHAELTQITLPIAKNAVTLASVKEKSKKKVERDELQSKKADYEGIIRWKVSYVAEQIKDFELKYSKTIAESMRKAVRVTMIKLASQFRVSNERIAFLKKQGTWFV